MKFVQVALAFVVATSSAIAVVKADPDPRTIHLVNYRTEGVSKPTFIFRGDNPLFRKSDGKKGMDLEALHALMAENAKERTGVTLLPAEESYWRVVSLADPTHPNAGIEKAFWEEKHGTIGDHWVNWEIHGSKVYPPSQTPDQRAAAIAKNNTDGTLWGTDDLPRRIDELQAKFFAPVPSTSKQNLVYVHGADESVGGLITSYRLRFFDTIKDGGRLLSSVRSPCPAAKGARAAGGLAAIAPEPPALKAKADGDDDEARLTLTHAFALACDEVGKCPTVENTASIGWYCLYRNANPINGTFRDCLKGYRCDEREGWCLPNRC